MSAPSREELEALRADGLSVAGRRAFGASREATEHFDRALAPGIEEILDWIEQLRALFGDPPVDRTPWRGGDFRL